MRYVIAALAMLLTGAASAEEHVQQAAPYIATKPVECYPAQVLKNSLEIQYQEEQVFTGEGRAQGLEGLMTVVVMLYLNPIEETFTVVELQEGGFACVLGAGKIMNLGNIKGLKVSY